jgi:hypothetical protein
MPQIQVAAIEALKAVVDGIERIEGKRRDIQTTKEVMHYRIADYDNSGDDFR